jgi:hypothetical protein
MRASALPIAVIFTKFDASLLAISIAFAIGTALSLAMNYYADASLKLIDRRLVILSFVRTGILIALTPFFASLFPVGFASLFPVGGVG